jgi:predicted alpha/beta-fold hydrolase
MHCPVIPMPGSVAASQLQASPFPPFEPFPGLANGHLQTIVARYLPGPRISLPSRYVELPLQDGDRLAVLDSHPTSWVEGGPIVLMVHGLAGCARSPYVVRVARKLFDLGVRVVRMNLRGAGSGFGLAKGFYHAGRTTDVRNVAAWVVQQSPSSPLALVGFSLGANLVLKLASESAVCPVPGLDAVLAANPPLDLEVCCEYLRRPAGRIYDKNFTRQLLAEVRRFEAKFPELEQVDPSKIGSVYDFDEWVTAPRNGYRNAVHYYRESSAGPLVSRIEVPGLVVHAADDPFIPPEPFYEARFPEQVRLEIVANGGHLGYLARDRIGPDRRWLDARFVSWLVDRWGLQKATEPIPFSARTLFGRGKIF